MMHLYNINLHDFQLFEVGYLYQFNHEIQNPVCLRYRSAKARIIFKRRSSKSIIQTVCYKCVPRCVVLVRQFRSVTKILLTLLLLFQDLVCLVERYLEPLKDETFLSVDDIEELFGNIQEIVQFQKLFFHSLEDSLPQDDGTMTSESYTVFKQSRRCICPTVQISTIDFEEMRLYFYKLCCIISADYGVPWKDVRQSRSSLQTVQFVLFQSNKSTKTLEYWCVHF